MGKVQSENSVHHFAKVSGLNERARGGGGRCFSTSEPAAKMLTALNRGLYLGRQQDGDRGVTQQ